MGFGLPPSSIPAGRTDRAEAHREERRADADVASKLMASAEAGIEIRQNVGNQTKLISTLHKLREQFRHATSERQALSEHDITGVLNRALDGQDHHLVGNSDGPVRAAASEELAPRPDAEPSGGANPPDAGRGDAFETGDGSTLARLARGDVPTGTPTATPKAPTNPQLPLAPQAPVVAPQVLPAPAKPVVAAAVVTHEAPAPEGAPPTPQGQPASPTGQPVVVTETGVPAAPEAPAPGPGVHVFNYGEKPRPGTCQDPETIVAHLEAGANFRAKFGPSPDVAVPATLAQAANTFVVGRMVGSRTSSTSDRTSSNRSDGKGEGDSFRKSLGGALALGMRRQLARNAC